MAEEEGEQKPAGRPRRTDWRLLPYILLWVVGLIWLMARARYPQSFGIHPLRGRGGMLQDYWDSYLLAQRHQGWDLALLLWMWVPVGWFAGKAVHGLWKKRGNLHLRLFAEDQPPPAGPS